VWIGNQLCPPLVAAALASLQLIDPARPGLGGHSGSSRPGTDV
jgi:hypothetical protein